LCPIWEGKEETGFSRKNPVSKYPDCMAEMDTAGSTAQDTSYAETPCPQVLTAKWD
jgi:hypothetical protein